MLGNNMSLQSTAQEIINVIDPHQFSGETVELVPLEVEESDSSKINHSPMEMNHLPMEIVEVAEPGENLEIFISEIPGAPDNVPPIPEPVLEVEESKEEDENEASSKKPEKWNWGQHGAEGFISWVKGRLDEVPKHSGLDSAGLERAIFYLDRIDNEISKAMRQDLDGELDANKIEEVRSKIEDGLNRLHDRLEKIKKSKKRNKKKAEFEPILVKEGQKINGVKGGVYITVPLLISGIARTCVNSLVSAGHDIEQTYFDQVKKYKLNEREKSEVRWLLFDMGYVIRGDRGFLPEEDYNTTSSDMYDWQANYPG